MRYDVRSKINLMKLVLVILAFLATKAVADEASPAKLPEGTAKVALVLYDYLADQDHPQVVTDGKMHPGVIPGYTKHLDQDQIAKLLKALTQNHDQRDRYICDFAPHHGFVFEAQDGKILGSVSICFACRELHSPTFPKEGSIFYSYWGWPELKEIVRDAGLPILGSNEAYTTLRKSKSEQGVAPQSATRSESDSEGNDNPHPESKSRPR